MKGCLKPSSVISCQGVIISLGLDRKSLLLTRFFPLRRTVDYFTENKSRVFLAFLDCSKAFDRISHWGVFTKMIQHNVPLCFLLSIMFLYLNMSCTIKWNNETSFDFGIPTGTKQGGILSPDIFAMYMHDLIVELQSSGFGCHVIQRLINCIFFCG